MKRHKIFPTLVYTLDCSDLIEPVQKLLDSIKWEDEFQGQSDDLYILQKDTDLSKDFVKRVNSTLSEINYSSSLQMTTSWFNKTYVFNGIGRHIHTNSFWSSVFYFEENCGDLFFNKDHSAITVPVTKENVELQMFGEMSFPAEKGTLILFPSYLPHYVEQDNIDEPRYSLAMNYMPIRRCGDDDSTYDYR